MATSESVMSPLQALLDAVQQSATVAAASAEAAAKATDAQARLAALLNGSLLTTAEAVKPLLELEADRDRAVARVHLLEGELQQLKSQIQGLQLEGLSLVGFQGDDTVLAQDNADKAVEHIRQAIQQVAAHAAEGWEKAKALEVQAAASQQQVEQLCTSLQAVCGADVELSSVSPDHIQAAMQALGVTNIFDAAATYGALQPMLERSLRDEEELDRLRHHAAHLEAEVRELSEDCTRLRDQVRTLTELNERQAVALMERNEAYEVLQQHANQQKAIAERFRRDLENAGHIIGDLSTELETTRTRLRDQLDDAMNHIKSVVIKLDHRGMEVVNRVLRIIDRTTSMDKEQYFKSAHNVIKTMVVDLLGERMSGVSWKIDDDPKFLAKIPKHMYATLHKTLQQLVIAYDVMSDETKNNMTTAREIVANARTLLAIARFVTAAKLADTPPSVAPMAAAGAANNSMAPGGFVPGSAVGGSALKSPISPSTRPPVRAASSSALGSSGTRSPRL